MQTVIHVGLGSHATALQLDEEGYGSLRSYFERAHTRLRRNPDRDEILRDLEQSIGEKLAALPRSVGRIIAGSEVDAVLGQVGTVDPGSGNDQVRHTPSVRPRRFCRIEQGKWISGVCAGLAIRSGIRVGWVRAIFVLATIFTSGMVALVYLALVFALPVLQTRDEYVGPSP
ncbi:MAG TPA: PspC domain-containing protein [Rhodanobacter sp.]|nr:PspC domain-containing protein [Rhodanobacter sp.]